MPKATKNKKKSQQNPPKDPLGHQIWYKTKENGAGLPCAGLKTQSTSRVANTKANQVLCSP